MAVGVGVGAIFVVIKKVSVHRRERRGNQSCIGPV